MQALRIGDRVATHIEGPIVGERRDENGQAFKVEYSDSFGVTRHRWLFPAELYLDEEDVETAHVAVAHASLH